jgi:hypothetical protein
MFEGRKLLGKHRGRWEDAVWRATVSLLQARDRKAVARKKEGWRKEIGEATVQKRTKAP